MKVLGIDPGLAGGIAVIDIIDGCCTSAVVVDIPTAGTGRRCRVDAIGVQKFLLAHGPQHAFIERAQAMPKQGASSGFSYGRAVGAIEAVVAANAIPLTIVEPSIWKRFYRLAGGDKEAARQRALQLVPSVHGDLARRKDHGRAEALLIAQYGARTLTAGAFTPATVEKANVLEENVP
jgi:crossover junction endodeoxyribonuclease RuvC